eukprot:GHVT01010656.1.p1 GENE.GHVT01010656.1~~GHVT01010656.1.p1  ORF type:complete len:527 (-),score=126.63 GHVT01010656.1:1020-2600(-)
MASLFVQTRFAAWAVVVFTAVAWRRQPSALPAHGWPAGATAAGPAATPTGDGSLEGDDSHALATPSKCSVDFGAANAALRTLTPDHQTSATPTQLAAADQQQQQQEGEEEEDGNDDAVAGNVCYEQRDETLKELTAWRDNLKFILYDVKQGEGFHLQKEVVYRMAMVVHHLTALLSPSSAYNSYSSNRHTRCPFPSVVLVLPPWCRLAHWPRPADAQDVAKHPWGNFFDLKWMERKILFLEFSEFQILFQSRMPLSRPEVDLTLVMKFGDRTLHPDDPYISHPHLRPCAAAPPRWYRPPDADGNLHNIVYSGECSTLTSSAIGCYLVPMLTSQRAGQVFFDLLLGLRAPSRFLLKHAENILVPWPTELLHARLHDLLIPNKLVRDVAARTIAEYFGSNNFVAAHLRRGDFARVRQRDVPTLQQAASQAVFLLRQHQAAGIFICTDATEDEKMLLLHELARAAALPSDQIQKFVFFFKNEQKLLAGVGALVEVWIAASALQFMGTRGSRFSQAVRWERLLNGLKPAG